MDTSPHHDGIDVAYQRLGSSGDPLLLVMGIAADMLYWHNDFCAALIENGFQVVRFDNRDSGESTHLDWAGTPDRRRVPRNPDTAPYGWDMQEIIDHVVVSTPYASNHVNRLTLAEMQRDGLIESPNQQRKNTFPDGTIVVFPTE